MTNEEYWKKRLDDWEKKDKKDEEKYYKEIQKIYKNQSDEISKEISSLFSKYAKDNEISLAEAKKRCSKLDIEEYERKAKTIVENKDFSPEANKAMKIYNLTMKTSRLEMLKAHIELAMKDHGTELEKAMQKALFDETMKQYERLSGFMGKYIPDVRRAANAIVHADFHAAKWSERIWKHQIALRNQLNKIISTGLIQGKHSTSFVSEIRKKHDVSAANAIRLLRTEFTRCRNSVELDALDAMETDEFIVVNGSEDVLCDHCRSLAHLHNDRVIYKKSEAKIGENIPPFHPNCRCNIAPYVNHDIYQEWLDSDSDLDFAEYKEFGLEADQFEWTKTEVQNAADEVQNANDLILAKKPEYDKAVKNLRRCKPGSAKYNEYSSTIQKYHTLEKKQKDAKENLKNLNKIKNEAEKEYLTKYRDFINRKIGKLDFDPSKKYSGIWKDPKNLYDFMELSDERINNKIQYFKDRQKSLDPSSADYALIDTYLKNIEKLKEQADMFRPLYNRYKEIESALRKIGMDSDERFSQERKDAAYWFTPKNGGTRGADGILREVTGKIWKTLPYQIRRSLFNYTREFSCVNEPLRGIKYGFDSHYVGVGNVDFETIGMDYAGYARGEIKQRIIDMTEGIEKVSYDFDMWLNRGVDYFGMDSFFNCPMELLRYGTDEELTAALVGNKITEQGFLSCGVSKGKGFVKSIILNVYAPAGTKMIWAEPFSHYGNGVKSPNWDGESGQSYFGDEAEAILQRGTSFRVTKVYRSNGRLYFDLDVIDQSEENRQYVG